MLKLEDDELQKVIIVGSGAHSKVYKALHGKNVIAVKVQDGDIAMEVEHTKQFGKGDIFGPFEHGGKQCFTMPLADGTFKDFLDARKVTDEQAMEYLVQICEQLLEIHGAGKVHCNISLRNVLIYGTKAHISDFGSMKDVGDVWIRPSVGTFDEDLEYAINYERDLTSLRHLIAEVQTYVDIPGLEDILQLFE